MSQKMAIGKYRHIKNPQQGEKEMKLDVNGPIDTNLFFCNYRKLVELAFFYRRVL